MTDLTFSADLTITYNEADIISQGLSEDDLIILESHDNGNTWLQLETQRNPLDNTLRVEGIDSLSWYAIAAVSSPNTHTLQSDLDKNGIVDFKDFAVMSSQWRQKETWYNEN